MVSIIIPAYDRVDLLKLTLESVLKQTEIVYEIIVIDDNSMSNEILEVCDAYNVTYLKNDTNSGAQVSRNKGVEKAKYNYIAFLDSDDLWEFPNKLKDQYQILKNNNDICLVFTSLKYIDINGNLIDKNISKLNNDDLDTNFANTILKKDIIGTYSSVMIRKKDFIKAGKCNINLVARQDWDLWIRLSKIGNAQIISDAFTLYRIHDNQISSGVNRKIDGFSQLLIDHKKYFFEKKLKHIYYYHLSKLILLQKVSKIESRNFNLLYKDNKLPSNIILTFIKIIMMIPFTKNILINKLSSTYLFKGLFK